MGNLAAVTCEPPVCALSAVTVENAASSGLCGDGVTEIADGAACTVACANGFTASAAEAACTAGNLAAVTCEPPVCTLSAVTVENAASTGLCGAGVTEIADGAVCTVACAATFTASAAEAACTAGTLAAVTCE